MKARASLISAVAGIFTLFHAGAQRKVADTSSVALTLDDGPHDPATPRALDALEVCGLRAAFFMTGEAAEARPDLVRRCSEAGHELGNHGWTHSRMRASVLQEIGLSIQRTNEAIACAAGARPRRFRPPYGSWKADAGGVLEDLGMRLVLWNRMPCDYLPEVTPAWMESFLRKRLRGGDILVLHDNQKTAGRIGGFISAFSKVLDEKPLNAGPL